MQKCTTRICLMLKFYQCVLLLIYSDSETWERHNVTVKDMCHSRAESNECLTKTFHWIAEC